MMPAPRQGHRYVPWRKVPSWSCIRCGECCKRFLVTLMTGEALNLARKYGVPMVVRGAKYIMPCKANGSCVFLDEEGGVATCTIYFERPYVCRMYPFHVTQRDLGFGGGASYVDDDGVKLYVYIDATCRGVGYGRPIASLIPIVVSLWRRVVGV